MICALFLRKATSTPSKHLAAREEVQCTTTWSAHITWRTSTLDMCLYGIFHFLLPLLTKSMFAWVPIPTHPCLTALQTPQGQTFAERHQWKLWDLGVLPPLAGPPGWEQVPDGSEESLWPWHHRPTPASLRHKGQLHCPVRAHHPTQAHLQGGGEPGGRLLSMRINLKANQRTWFLCWPMAMQFMPRVFDLNFQCLCTDR